MSSSVIGCLSLRSNFTSTSDQRGSSRVLFYHSSADPPAVAGTARIVRAAYPDPTQFDPRDAHYDRESLRDDPRWYAVDVKFESKFDREVTLPELRAARPLAKMELLRRGNRLSVQPVTAAEWKQIVKMAVKP